MSQEGPSGEYPYQPYGAPYGQQPPPQHGYGYGYGYPPPPRPPEGPRATAIVALVLNLLSIVGCCNIFAIPGAILAGMALGRSSTQPASAKGLLVWCWTLLGVGLALNLGIFLFLGLNGYLDD
ncbi:hypothetical protein [Nonomuraea aurantiaca]|jgi:hypothetical protein|uniref:hypothetical protein n=1 Tax=Nonomuraea aurantiaca TaxID=2878562 RepID=UPI001CDA4982|nr:hypothetical protein [Nonomuraea aurantiaca]MCA2228046.1 hypothetical protein [Nonomuraea aurantiaca]